MSRLRTVSPTDRIFILTGAGVSAERVFRPSVVWAVCGGITVLRKLPRPSLGTVIPDWCGSFIPCGDGWRWQPNRSGVLDEDVQHERNISIFAGRLWEQPLLLLAAIP